MGLIITHLLKVPLTESTTFRTHLEDLTRVEDLKNQVFCKKVINLQRQIFLKTTYAGLKYKFHTSLWNFHYTISTYFLNHDRFCEINIFQKSQTVFVEFVAKHCTNADFHRLHITECNHLNQADVIFSSHSRPQKIFQRERQRQNLLILFRTMQCKWTITKHFTLSTPQKKFPMLRQ